MSNKTEKIKEAMAVATEVLKDSRNTSEQFIEVVLEYVRQSDQVDKDLENNPPKTK